MSDSTRPCSRPVLIAAIDRRAFADCALLSAIRLSAYQLQISVLPKKFSLIRAWKFPVPFHREFQLQAFDLTALLHSRDVATGPDLQNFPDNFPVCREMGPRQVRSRLLRQPCSLVSKGQRERHGHERDQRQHPEDVHVGEE